MENHWHSLVDGARKLSAQPTGPVAEIVMKRHLITFLFLLLAIALYSAGAAVPATLLLILGVVAEGVFWLRVSGKDKRIKKKVL